MKRADWQYEQERRLVVRKSELREGAGGYLADVSPSALKYVIVGPHASKDLRLKCMDVAARFGASLFEFRKARTNYAPYFSDLNLSTDVVATWEESTFRSWKNTCASCREPARALFDGLCEWCAISEAAADSGARRSMLTLTLKYGIDAGLPFEFDGLVPRGQLIPAPNVTALTKAGPNTPDLPF